LEKKPKKPKMFNLIKKLKGVFPQLALTPLNPTPSHPKPSKMSMTIENLEKRIAALEAQRSTDADRIAALESQKPAKAPKKPKAPTDEDKPKREANWFIVACGPVREAIKPAVAAFNSALPEGGKKLAGTAAPQVCRLLRHAGKLTPEIQPTEAEIMAAFELFLEAHKTGTLTPDGPRIRAEKSARSSAASSAASGKAAKPKAELSEADAAALKAQKAAKAAATRAANKAKKTAEEEAATKAAAEAEEAEADDSPLEAYEWKGDIGKGVKAYERIDSKGVSYIYSADGDDFKGIWDEATKKLNPAGKDIKMM